MPGIQRERPGAQARPRAQPGDSARRPLPRRTHLRCVPEYGCSTSPPTPKGCASLMSEVTLPEPFDLGEGYGKTQLERAGHTGELRRLVPPLLRALRRAASGGGARPGGRGRGRCACCGRPGTSRCRGPVMAPHLCDIVLAARPEEAAAHVVAAKASPSLLEVRANFWERAWLRRSLEHPEGA